MAPSHVKLRGAPSELPLPFRFDPETVRRGLNFTLDSGLGDLDLLGEVSGIGTFEQMLPLSEVKAVDAVECRIFTIEGLIRAKRTAGRKKDLITIEELEGLKDLKNSSGRDLIAKYLPQQILQPYSALRLPIPVLHNHRRL
jgi:hypothetical protein